MSKKVFVDIHVLQTVPPSCINRDDTGSPKTAIYGGVNRARVSSQAWKRAIRMYFNDVEEGRNQGIRTKSIVALVADEIAKLNTEISEDQAVEMAIKALKDVGLKIKSAEKGTDSLFFMSTAQAKALATIVTENPDAQNKSISKETKELMKEALTEHPSPDIALFGRMVADDPSLNTDASAQVAHAISVNAVENEFDFFTAVDDCSPEDNAGAGHLGTVEYNSSTLYRYATVAFHELSKHLKEQSPEALIKFLEGFVTSMPTGKQNTFANRTLPSYLMVCLREDQPINMVGAFEAPVYPSERGVLEPAAERFVNHVKSVYENFAENPNRCLVVGEELKDLGEKLNFEKLKEQLAEDLKSYTV
ncbi:MAG: type I-E CRISPR-associated protein Cas7/Cse4/CasC [Eubacteriales bacterium]|nr:type I-E CRISPR-associated protein Cas7/Cse4/CasC [Eubacteriales bacterium]